MNARLFACFLLTAGCTIRTGNDGPDLEDVDAPAVVALNRDGRYVFEPKVRFRDPDGDDVAEARISYTTAAGESDKLVLLFPSRERASSGTVKITLAFPPEAKGEVSYEIVLVDEKGNQSSPVKRSTALMP